MSERVTPAEIQYALRGLLPKHPIAHKLIKQMGAALSRPSGADAEAYPNPPYPIGGGNNCKHAGWHAFFNGKGRDECPFPQARPDLRKGYEQGWDDAKAAAPPLPEPVAVAPDLEPLGYVSQKGLAKAAQLLRDCAVFYDSDYAYDRANECTRAADALDALATLSANLEAMREQVTTGIEQEQHLMSRLGIETRAREAAEAEVARLRTLVDEKKDEANGE